MIFFQINSTKFSTSISNSFDEKASLLDLSGSAKVGIFSGLIEVGGNVGFLNKSKQSKNTENVTLKFSFKKKEEKLRPEMIENPVLDSKVQSKATHVVIAIEYGVNAFLQFSSKKNLDSGKWNVSGGLKGQIEKITLALEASGKFDKEHEELNESVHCEFQVGHNGIFHVHHIMFLLQDRKAKSPTPKLCL